MTQLRWLAIHREGPEPYSLLRRLSQRVWTCGPKSTPPPQISYVPTKEIYVNPPPTILCAPPNILCAPKYPAGGREGGKEGQKRGREGREYHWMIWHECCCSVHAHNTEWLEYLTCLGVVIFQRGRGISCAHLFLVRVLVGNLRGYILVRQENSVPKPT